MSMNRMTRLTFAFVAGVLVASLTATPMHAQDREAIDVASLGPQVGETIPDFSLPDQHGRVQTLDSIVGENGAMIVFHRSADW